MKKLLLFLALIFGATTLHAQTIAALPAATTENDTDTFTVDQASDATTYHKMTLLQLKGYAQTSVPWANLTGVPTTAAGYGITNGSTIDLWGAKMPYSGTLTITSGKTVNVTNTLTFAGMDGSTLNIGAGGTLGSNAFTSTAYVPQTTTVNGHALSASVTVSASDITTGTLPIAQVPTGTSGSTVAIGNDARFPASVTGLRNGAGAGSADTAATHGLSSQNYIAPSDLGSGVGTALGNAMNAAGGLIGYSANGSTLPVRTGFLIAGTDASANTYYGTGKERCAIAFSTDGIHYQAVPGFDGYSPPTSGDGLRDSNIIKVGNNYLICSTLSYSGGIRANKFDVASSTDLINWTHVATVTPGSSNTSISPRWFSDPNTGNLYAVTSTNTIAITQCTSGDGVTWSGTTNNFTLSGGGSISGVDASLIYYGGQYILFFENSSTLLYHYATSASLLTGYTDQGVVSSAWPKAEGLFIAQTSTGSWYATFYDKNSSDPTYLTSLYSTASSLTGTWSSPTSFPTLPNGQPQFIAGFDNFSGIAANDAGTMRDINVALKDSYYPVPGSFYSQPDPRTYVRDNSYYVNGSSTIGWLTPPGTLSQTGTAVTGSGTNWTQSVHWGDVINTSGVRAEVVEAVNSDTSLTTYESNIISSGTAYTITPAIATRLGFDGSFCIAGNGELLLSSQYPYRTTNIALWNSAPAYPINIFEDSGGNIGIQSTRTGGQTQANCVYFDGTYANSGAGGWGSLKLSLLGVPSNDIGIGIGNSGYAFQFHNGGWGSGFSWLGASALLLATMSNADGTFTSYGNLISDTAGKGVQVKEGSNAKQGTATLTAGTVTVSDSAVTANSRIFLTTQSPGGTVGAPYVSARTAGTSFTITSTSGADTSTVGYEIFEPAP